MDRPIKFNKDGIRGRSWCARECTYVCNARFGTFTIKEEKGIEKVTGWGVCNFEPHSCREGRKLNDRLCYPAYLGARILLRNAVKLKAFTQESATLLLKPYFIRQPTRDCVRKCRSKFEDLLYGESDKRIKLLPDIVKRINAAGHFCAYSMING